MADSLPSGARTRGRWRGSRRRLRVLMFLATAFVLTGAVLTAYALDAVRDLDLDTVDARFTIRGEQQPPRDIVVVAIDDVSFDELRERWPFPRSLHAKAIDALRRGGARAIAYDVQFTEPTSESEDNALIDAVARTPRVVLATTEVDEQGRSNVFGGEDVLRDIGARSGNALLPNDPGGVLRRVPYSVQGLKSFAVVAAESTSGRRVSPAALDGDTAWIDYAGGPGTVETVSFSRVIDGRYERDLFRGKTAVVGPAAPSLQDVHPTSTAGEDLMSGAEIQANAISTVLRDFPLKQSPDAVDVILIVLFGLVGPLTAFLIGPLRSILVVLLAAAAFTIAVQLAFNAGLIVSFVYPLASLVVGGVAALGVGLLLNAFERERMRDLFARFVPEPVVDEVLANTDEDLRLGGEWCVVTVMFSDIRGFTTYSETRPPDEVIEVLNRYLGAMSEVILDHGGTLVSYIGDGIMAVFGAPIEQLDHADRAVAAAREMTGETLDRFNDWLRSEGLGDGFRIGIGLNSGPVMAGNVGSQRRLEYTTIGDTTNTAARLEGMTKGTPHMVFLSESTRVMMRRAVPGIVHVDEMEVRGRKEPVTVWSFDGSAEAAPSRVSAETERPA